MLATFRRIRKNERFIFAEDLLKYFNIEINEFLLKVFSSCYNYEFKAMGFKEFVVTLWNFCTLRKSNIGENESINFLFQR